MPQWMLEQLIYLVPYVQVLDMKWKKSSNIVECQKEHLQAPFLLPNTYRVRSPFSFVSSSGVSSNQPNGCFYQHWFQHYQLTQGGASQISSSGSGSSASLGGALVCRSERSGSSGSLGGVCRSKHLHPLFLDDGRRRSAAHRRRQR